MNAIHNILRILAICPNIWYMAIGRRSLQKIAADALIGSNLVPLCAIRDSALIMLNERCAALFGRAGDQSHLDVPLRDVVADADWPRLEGRLHQVITKPGSAASIAFSAVRTDGSIVDLELAGTVANLPDQAVLVAVATDITQKRLVDAQLNYLAFNDGLTGLANRTLFFDRLRQTLLTARRRGEGFALLACDLDSFKAVNDTHGHEIGDAVLQAAAARLRA
jgi:hypothetical protein